MVLLILLITVFVTTSSAQDGTIPAFPLGSSDIELTRIAQPSTYFDKVGRKFALLGYESGMVEAWAYPLKLLRNFEFSFFIGSSTEPIHGRQIVRRISVTPEVTTLTYTFQSFTVKAHYITPVNESGAFILLDVSSTEPLTIVCSFLPVLQPMWPAGLGGQSARWLDDLKAYQISEPTRKNTGYVGSPAAAGISYTPAHMLSDLPNQFRIIIDKPSRYQGKFIPIIFAGGKGIRDSIRTIYSKLASDPEYYYKQNVKHYTTLRQSTMSVTTPNRELNLAFEWAKISYDNLLVNNPDLGLGMVAGLGTSGTGGRPGFGWFFGGDTYINSMSLNSYGAFLHSKDALAFTQRWQRDDGKMAHELTQAAAYLNWWKDYPYGYIHGDTSPFYICAMADYYAMTGDLDFVKSSWSSLKRAYEWSKATDENGDGLMDNKKAGLGALEYGPLTDIQSDIYTGAIFVKAVSAMAKLAKDVGDKTTAEQCSQYAVKADFTFKEKFWDEKNQQYAYAFTASGEHIDIVSPWNSVGLMWELGDPERSVKSLQKINSAELTTDWGIRSISNKSTYYQALNYNYGAVWPFLTSYIAAAQYKHHFALQGYNSLMASVHHTFDNSLGQVTEVFSGTHNIWPQEAVAHQGFCTAGVVLPLVRGLLGLESDAPNRHFSFAPHLPADWNSVTISNYKIGKQQFSLRCTQEDSTLTMNITPNNSEVFRCTAAPALSPGSDIHSVTVNGRKTPFRKIFSHQTVQPVVDVQIDGPTTILIRYTPTVAILPPMIKSVTGDMNRGLKIISTALKDKIYQIIVEGLSGNSYRLELLHANTIAKVSGATLHDSALKISIPSGPEHEFLRHTITLTTY